MRREVDLRAGWVRHLLPHGQARQDEVQHQARDRRLQNADGGFGLSAGRGSDAQSTAWAIQAFIAAGARPGRAAFRYLTRLRRSDGSYRYSAKYATTPVWVTAQVLPALARRAFPLR